jgi:hypothetical protein
MYNVFIIEATIFLSLFPLFKAILFHNLNQLILVEEEKKFKFFLE